MITKVITMNHPDLQKRRLSMRSKIKLRISKTSIRFSASVVKETGFRKFDKVVLVSQGKELWVRKAAPNETEGFVLMGTEFKVLHINDTSLSVYISEFFNKQLPFDLRATLAFDSIYLKAE